MSPGKKNRKLFYLQIVLAVALAGVVAAYALPRSDSDRQGALLGVCLSACSAPAALYLKKWAVERSLKASLSVLGIVFAIRLVLVSVGLMLVLGSKAGVVAFTLGFFGTYFPLQWVEISYLLGERGGRGGGFS